MKKTLLIAAASLFGFAAMAQNISGHVNTTEVIQLMPEMDSVRVQVEAAQKETQETYQAMISEFQTKYQQFEQKQGSWTQSIRESKQRELQEIQQRIEDFGQSAQQDLQELQQRLQAPVYQKAMDAIRKIAAEKKLVYVFDEGSLIYVDPLQSVNITPEVRKAVGIPEGRTLEALQQELQARAQAAQGEM